MPTCENCGEDNNFRCDDGMFYCLECDTQSQHIVDEQTVGVYDDRTHGPTALRKHKQKTQSRDFGRVWFTVEGYQLVIKAHIDALIKIGVKAGIKDVMKQIWFKYVHITGMAVIDSGMQCETVHDSQLSVRDYFFKYRSKDDAAVTAHKRKRKFSSGVQMESDAESEGNSLNLGDSFSNDEPSDDEGALSSSSCPPVGRSAFTRSYADVKIMSLNKIIVFCYLALRWMEELFTVGDLIHWAESGMIPYYDAGDCFPSDMKLYWGDEKTFIRARLLKYDEIVLLSRRLHHYIGMPTLPNAGVMSLVGRYLYQLNLPLGLISYASRIANALNQRSHMKSKTEYQYKGGLQSLKLPDLLAASVIAILLKLCFGLDGEKELSMEIQDSCIKHENCQVFSWTRWIRQHLHHLSSDAGSSSFLDPMSKGCKVDLHACMEHYINVILKGCRHKAVRACNTGVNVKEFMEMRQLPFNKLVELQGSSGIMEEKGQERIGGNMVKILGRRHSSPVGNLTSACVENTLHCATTSDHRNYAHYNSPAWMNTLEHYPPSYAFVLLLLTDITKANWKLIHEYIVDAEFLIFCKTSAT